MRRLEAKQNREALALGPGAAPGWSTTAPGGVGGPLAWSASTPGDLGFAWNASAEVKERLAAASWPSMLTIDASDSAASRLSSTTRTRRERPARLEGAARLEYPGEERRVDPGARVSDGDLRLLRGAADRERPSSPRRVNLGALWSRFPAICVTRVASASAQTSVSGNASPKATARDAGALACAALVLSV
jgi:hypothetical protein